jgi:hypothetical protein
LQDLKDSSKKTIIELQSRLETTEKDKTYWVEKVGHIEKENDFQF